LPDHRLPTAGDGVPARVSSNRRATAGAPRLRHPLGVRRPPLRAPLEAPRRRPPGARPGRRPGRLQARPPGVLPLELDLPLPLSPAPGEARPRPGERRGGRGLALRAGPDRRERPALRPPPPALGDDLSLVRPLGAPLGGARPPPRLD